MLSHGFYLIKLILVLRLVRTGGSVTLCVVWNRDEENELSDYGEICLVTVKGSPNFIFKHFPCGTEKPGLLKKVIDIGYPGWSKVEIFKGDGREIW